ncbi:MAG: FAD-dependent oxidoreductase [Gordonibacter sp.]|uniref:FAD-dependent oxidoreductase n=4 Tax=Gordonibacter sp. TaxID=1968902 RepID=UPI002FC6A1C7
MEERTGSSRRDFFKGVAVATSAVALTAGGALSLAGCTAAEGGSTAKAKHECDVVVAGGGIGGLAAAVSAAETGAKVILVEASGKVGGTSRFAAGAFGPRFGTDWEVVKKKAPASDPVLGKYIVENWDPYVEWIDGLGLTTEKLSETSPYLWMGGKRDAAQGSKSNTDEYLQQFGQIFADKGGTTLVSTRAVKVLTDDKGKATGVRAESNGEVFDIKAKSVILATGGFQCDKEMVTKYIGRHADLSQAQCIPYLDGSGIKMGVEVGAQLSRSFGSYYGHPQPWPADYLNYTDPEAYEAVDNVDDVHVAYYGTTGHSIQGMGVYLNCAGERFVNEGMGSSLVNQEIMQQYMARAYLVFDEPIRKAIETVPFFQAAVIGGARIDHMLEMGFPVFQANSIEELGKAISSRFDDSASFNTGNAASAIAEYNEAVAAGTTAAMKIPHVSVTPPMPIGTAPFYAIPVVGGIMATFGGLKINENTEVMGVHGHAIPGLYAVPGCAGGIMNGDYWCVMSGYSVLGRLSGQQSADFAAAQGTAK